MRFVHQGVVKILTIDKMNELMERDKKLQDFCLKYLMKKNKSNTLKPLDYVLSLSDRLMKKIFVFYRYKLCTENRDTQL